MSIELKIKSKHLSLESKVIRFEEQKLIKQIKWLDKNDPNRGQPSWLGKSDYWKAVAKHGSLVDHRKHVVGRENRATFLARAYIAGRPYKEVEAKRKDERAWEFNNKVIPRVLEMVKKYHPDWQVRRNITIETIVEWCC